MPKGHVKNRKDACPKKVCHMSQKGMSKIKDACPKKVCHMLIRHVKKRV